MSIRSTISDLLSTPKRRFPVLRRNIPSGKVVLFTNETSGVYLSYPEDPGMVGKVVGGLIDFRSSDTWDFCSITLTSET